MNRRRKSSWSAIVLAAVLLQACSAAVADVPTARVQRQRFVHRVEADGNLRAEQATEITVPLGNREPMKLAWLAANGSQVKEGEILVRFDPTSMEQELFAGEVQKAKAEMQGVQREREQETAIANLERDALMAERQLEHAREFRTDDAEIFSRNEIIESQIDESLATERHEHATEMQDVRSDLASVDLQLLELEERKAQLQIERAQAGLRELEVRAPHDGIFVLRADRGEPPTVGQMVWPTMAIAEIPRLDAMKAIVYVLEADAGGLEVGMPADIRLEAHPEGIVKGKVRRIASVAQRRSRWSPVQYFEVELELEGTDPERMKPGQRVRATIFLRDLPDVIAVPREAIFDAAEAPTVYRRSGNGFEAVAVQLGPAALGRVVITSGLEPGDVIALEDPIRGGGATPDSGAGPTALEVGT